MQYELYVDSLFLINFVMNLYLLLLVNRSTLRTATRGRLLLGAVAGGVCGMLPFLLPGPILLKGGLTAVVGTVGMLFISFPVKGFRMFLRLLEKLLLYSFCMGGALLFLIRSIPQLRSFLTGIFGILGAGGLTFLFLAHLRERKVHEDSICRAELICGDERLQIMALVDSGNSLIEPISGKPVCIVTEPILIGLRKALPPGCRAIPYHSIGKQRGILEGYLLPELVLDIDGIRKSFAHVYIAASPQGISESKEAEAESIKMIVNPMLLSEQKKGGPHKRQNERIYDTESSFTG
ncbi:MAG: sigma-E processing peptidase SpoIIGA [Acetatifactor sp.]|nr:sigma-E processing peptidase SpoIIGA [Acetatifactor sp.]